MSEGRIARTIGERLTPSNEICGAVLLAISPESGMSTVAGSWPKFSESGNLVVWPAFSLVGAILVIVAENRRSELAVLDVARREAHEKHSD